MKVERTEFGVLKDGTRIDAIEVSNDRGLEARFITFGGILQSLLVPGRSGRVDDVVLGFDSIEPYEAGHPFFGALVGRFANRIGGGTFTIDGQEYTVARNDIYGVPDGEQARNHLHGGFVGYDKRVWDAEVVSDAASAGVLFSLLSPDGEEGYPGEIEVSVRCTITESGELTFDYTATTSKPTPCNLTNHSYWNLAGAGSGTVNEHLLTLNCPYYLTVDDEIIPTGEIAEVAGGPMDFREPKPIGRDLEDVPGGYDHCFAARDRSGAMKLIAVLQEPSSGRTMRVATTKPAVQFYGGNFLDGSIIGKQGKRYDRHGALCLETEHYPDAVNHENFPSCVLRPGETYRHTTVYSFGTE